MFVEKHKDELVDGVTKFIDKISEMPEYIVDEQDISSLINNVVKATNNARVMVKTGMISGGPKKLESALNVLSRENCQLSIKCRCLECIFKYRDTNPYFAQVSNPKEILMATECPRCKGKGLVYAVDVGYPAGVSQLMMPNTNWLPEVVIGYALSSLDEVEKVFVHKIIHYSEKGKNLGKGAECDVTLITKDKRLFLVEVSTSQQTAKIQETAHRKVENFKNKGIRFDGFAFVSSDPIIGDFYTLSDKISYVFKASHIRSIETYIRENLIKIK